MQKMPRKPLKTGFLVVWAFWSAERCSLHGVGMGSALSQMEEIQQLNHQCQHLTSNYLLSLSRLILGGLLGTNPIRADVLEHSSSSSPCSQGNNFQD